MVSFPGGGLSGAAEVSLLQTEKAQLDSNAQELQATPRAGESLRGLRCAARREMSPAVVVRPRAVGFSRPALRENDKKEELALNRWGSVCFEVYSES